MKKIILILVILFCSCNSKENQIENVEIISYYYKLNENQTKFILDYLHYSIIDEDGNAETIKRVDNDGMKYVEFRSLVDENLLEEISKKNIELNDKYYEQKIDTVSVDIYCGPITRVKIKFKDSHNIIISYSESRNNSKYSLFIKLLNNLEKNFTERKFSSIDLNNSVKLKSKQKEFEKYTVNKDTLTLPFPPLPKKVNLIKFKK